MGKEGCFLEAYKTVGGCIARGGARVEEVEWVIVIGHVLLVWGVRMAEEDDVGALLLCQALKSGGAVFDVVVVTVGKNDLMPLEGDGIYFTDGCATEGGDVIVVTAYDYPGDVWKEVGECVDVGKTVTEEKDDLGIAVHIKRFTHKERRAVGIGKNENFQVVDPCFHNKTGECIQWLQINEEGE